MVTPEKNAHSEKNNSHEQTIPTEKRFRPGMYVAAFILTTLIFVFGILVGHQFTAAKLNQLDGLQQELHARTLGTELQTLLLTEFP